MIGEANDKPSPIGERAEPAATLGQVLKTARSARDLTLEQVSMELRIEAQQLLALEQDQFERIGAPVFVKGYLRHYGQRLGLDYGDLLVLYYKQVDRHEVVVQPSRSIKLRDERQITVWIIAGVVIAVLIVLAFWWFRGSGGLAAISGLVGLELDGAPPIAAAAETRTAALDHALDERQGQVARLTLPAPGN